MNSKKEGSSPISRRSFVANTGVAIAGSAAALGAGLAVTPARAEANMDYSTLLVERRDNGLLIVTLNRPEAGNAVNTQMGLELLDFWTGLVRDGEAGKTRCVVLTGAREWKPGTKAASPNSRGGEVISGLSFLMIACPKMYSACPKMCSIGFV